MGKTISIEFYELMRGMMVAWASTAIHVNAENMETHMGDQPSGDSRLNMFVDRFTQLFVLIETFVNIFPFIDVFQWMSDFIVEFVGNCFVYGLGNA